MNEMSEYDASAKKLATLVYALQALSFIFAITFIAAVIVNYLKRDEIANSWVETHFRWQIRTFWFGMLWGLVGTVTLFIGVGYLLLLADAIWIVYRIVKGWLDLADNKPMAL